MISSLFRCNNGNGRQTEVVMLLEGIMQLVLVLIVVVMILLLIAPVTCDSGVTNRSSNNSSSYSTISNDTISNNIEDDSVLTRPDDMQLSKDICK